MLEIWLLQCILNDTENNHYQAKPDPCQAQLMELLLRSSDAQYTCSHVHVHVCISVHN